MLCLAGPGWMTLPRSTTTARCRRRMICIAQGKRVYPPLFFPHPVMGKRAPGFLKHGLALIPRLK